MTRDPLQVQLERLDARIDWERRDRGSMRPSLAPMEDLMDRLGRPERSLRVVHVAGTKGKGSTAALIGAGLRRAGLRVGVYSSPHVESVNERLTIGGQPVADGPLAAGIESALAAAHAAEAERTAASAATWFDLLTAACLVVLREQGVEWAVLEVGLGGRLDSTNVVHPALCVITTIDLEHTEVLGDTRAAIALEKAGILCEGVPLVTGVLPVPGLGPDDDAGAVVAERAAALGAPVTGVELGQGTIEEANRSLARAALDELGRRGELDSEGRPVCAALLDEETARAARLPGRQERTSVGRLPVLLDGAHVASSLVRVLGDAAGDPSLPGAPVCLLSLAADKDVGAVLEALQGRVDGLICTDVPSGRHAPARSLAEAALELGIDAICVPEPDEAFTEARRRADERGWILVTGSLYLVGELRPILR